MTIYSLDGRRPACPATARFWIAPDAAVIGEVVLGEDCSVWFGAVVRGDNEPIRIGAGTNIQDLVLIHTDPGYPATIGAGCTIGHRAILHGCAIGDNSLIGMGAIVLNGARIGKNCIIGAGALVAENKSIADNTLVIGVPGRVIRRLDEAAAARIADAAAVYVRKWKRYRSGLEAAEKSG